jgi:hypothetical protein
MLSIALQKPAIFVPAAGEAAGPPIIPRNIIEGTTMPPALQELHVSALVCWMIFLPRAQNKKARRFPSRLFLRELVAINASRTVDDGELCDVRTSYAQPHENLV